MKIFEAKIPECTKLYIDNNKLKNTLCFTGDHGIGKTSVIYDYCKNKNIGFEKISLSNLDDLGELSGLPCTEYEMIFEDTSYWITEIMKHLFSWSMILHVLNII